MSKEYLKKLRLLAITGGIIANTLFLSGCGVEEMALSTDETTEKTKEDDQEQIPSEYLNNKGKFDKHYHFIVNIGGTAYIFRECETNCSSGYVGSYMDYQVSDEESNKTLINGRTKDYTLFDIDSYESELATQAFEDELIENGARLYKGLGK